MEMEHRQREALRRIYQADRMLQNDGHEPERFVLLYTGDGPIIMHPRWNDSWAQPSDETVDDLGELGLLRVELPAGRPRGFTRKFSLAVHGRREAQAIDAQMLTPVASGAGAPMAYEVLRWLVALVERDPSSLDDPASVLDRATHEGVISIEGRDALATRMLALISEGYLQGDVPRVEYATATQLLLATTGLQLSMKASDLLQKSGTATSGDVVNIIVGQVALGDIDNFVTFADVLKRASDVVDTLTDDQETRTTAKRLLDQMQGQAASAAKSLVGPTAAGVAAAAIARALGLA